MTGFVRKKIKFDKRCKIKINNLYMYANKN